MPTRFSLAQVETAKANLDALPAADKDLRQVGLQSAIKALAPTLRKLATRGYSQQKIIELLRDQDIPISASTLKHYLGPKNAKRPEGESAGERKAGTAKAGPRAGASAEAGPAASLPSAAPAAAAAATPAANGTTKPTTVAHS